MERIDQGIDYPTKKYCENPDEYSLRLTRFNLLSSDITIPVYSCPAIIRKSKDNYTDYYPIHIYHPVVDPEQFMQDKLQPYIEFCEMGMIQKDYFITHQDLARCCHLNITRYPITFDPIFQNKQPIQPQKWNVQGHSYKFSRIITSPTISIQCCKPTMTLKDKLHEWNIRSDWTNYTTDHSLQLDPQHHGRPELALDTTLFTKMQTQTNPEFCDGQASPSTLVCTSLNTPHFYHYRDKWLNTASLLFRPENQPLPPTNRLTIYHTAHVTTLVSFTPKRTETPLHTSIDQNPLYQSQLHQHETLSKEQYYLQKKNPEFQHLHDPTFLDTVIAEAIKQLPDDVNICDSPSPATFDPDIFLQKQLYIFHPV